MAKKKAPYVIRDPDSLNEMFYRGYDVDFIYNKAHSLWVIANNGEAFRKLVEESTGESADFGKKYVEAMRAEIHFAQFHQFEAFFALLVAVYQDLPHWVYLTSYETREIKTLVEAYQRRDIKTLTNGAHTKMDDFLNHSIYLGLMPLDAGMQSNWQANLDNIVWFLDRMSKRYLEGVEYNAYKHGLRVIAGPSFLTLRPDDNPQGGFTWASDDSITFLEAKDIGEGGRTVYETTKHFNPLESMKHLSLMREVLATVKVVRLARLKIAKGEQIEEDSVTLNVFFNLDKESLKPLAVNTRWSFTI